MTFWHLILWPPLRDIAAISPTQPNIILPQLSFHDSRASSSEYEMMTWPSVSVLTHIAAERMTHFKNKAWILAISLSCFKSKLSRAYVVIRLNEENIVIADWSFGRMLGC